MYVQVPFYGLLCYAMVSRLWKLGTRQRYIKTVRCGLLGEWHLSLTGLKCPLAPLTLSPNGIMNSWIPTVDYTDYRIHGDPVFGPVRRKQTMSYYAGQVVSADAQEQPIFESIV